jgi:hypothetical protein
VRLLLQKPHLLLFGQSPLVLALLEPADVFELGQSLLMLLRCLLHLDPEQVILSGEPPVVLLAGQAATMLQLGEPTLVRQHLQSAEMPFVGQTQLMLPGSLAATSGLHG